MKDDDDFSKIRRDEDRVALIGNSIVIAVFLFVIVASAKTIFDWVF